MSRGLAVSRGSIRVGPEPRAGRPVGSSRHLQDAWWLLGAAVVLVACAAAAKSGIPGVERSVFRTVNGDAVAVPKPFVWPVMQLGNIVAVPVVAIAVALSRRYLLALAIAVGGIVAYVLAKIVKDIVLRGRPADLLPHVRLRGGSEHRLGFVSGHASVVALLAMAVLPYLGRRARWAVIAVAVAVCLARVYIGAHLPLDVVGGAALGLAIGAGIRLVLGRPVPC